MQVREKCQAVMIAKAEIQAQKTALEQHCNKKAECASLLQPLGDLA